MTDQRDAGRDPREHIETADIAAVMILDETMSIDGKAYWDIINPEGTDWAQLVAFAQKILAANEAWLDSQTPTLEELRAKYPEWSMLSIRVGDGRFRGALDIHGCPGGAECRWTTGPWGTERDALRWLAAKLEELTDE